MCGTASCWAKLALVCAWLGLVLHIAGVASNHWMAYHAKKKRKQITVGLWRQKFCVRGDCADDTVDEQFVTDEFKAVRGLEVTALCVMVVATALLTTYVIFRGTRNRAFAIVILVLCALAAIFSSIGMIVFMVNIPDPYAASFSLGLTVIAYMLFFLAAALLIPDILQYEDSYPRSTFITPSPYIDRRNWGGDTPRSSRGVITPISYRGGGVGDGYGGGKWFP